MLIQEKETASGKTTAKARPTLKSSSTSGWDFTPLEQRQWIDIEIQESKDPYCFQVSKFITRLLRHSQKLIEKKMHQSFTTKLWMNAKKLSDDTRYWSDEMMKQFANAPYWSIDKSISVLAKGVGQKKRFQYCLNPNYPQKFLYLPAIQGHSGSTINPALQDNVLLPEGSPSIFITSETEKN